MERSTDGTDHSVHYLIDMLTGRWRNQAQYALAQPTWLGSADEECFPCASDGKVNDFFLAIIPHWAVMLDACALCQTWRAYFAPRRFLVDEQRADNTAALPLAAMICASSVARSSITIASLCRRSVGRTIV